MAVPNVPKVKVGRVKPLVFLKEVRVELSKVVWPTRSQATKLTLIVMGVSVFTAILLGSFDYLFTKLMELTLKK